MIEFKNITKTYLGRNEPCISDLSLIIKEGEILALVGSSGAGKSTLLKMINRLIEPTSGTLAINQYDLKSFDLKKLRRSIGYVFQKSGLFPHFSVAQNIEIVLKLACVAKPERDQRVEELLDFMGLGQNFKKYLPEQLSGGEQQRVQVARALAFNPPILLMDEPFGALDVITRASLQDKIIRLKENYKKTIIIVTHDIIEAFKFADRIAIMHQGSIHQISSKEELIQNPQTDFVKLFLNAGLKSIKLGESYY